MQQTTDMVRNGTYIPTQQAGTDLNLKYHNKKGGSEDNVSEILAVIISESSPAPLSSYMRRNEQA